MHRTPRGIRRWIPNRYEALFLVGLFLATVLALPSPPARADVAGPTHVAGCNTKIQTLAMPYYEDEVFFTPDIDGTPNYHKIRLSTSTVYWYCPNGIAADRIKVKYYSNCWTYLVKPEHGFFAAVVFAPETRTSAGSLVNPPSKRLPDNDNAVQDCVTQDVPLAEEQWMLMQNRPETGVFYHVSLNYEPDFGGWYHTAAGDKYKRLDPDTNAVLRDWHD